MKRVSLLPHRNDWSELERDAVTMRQGVIRAKSEPVPGSVQWVFATAALPDASVFAPVFEPEQVARFQHARTPRACTRLTATTPACAIFGPARGR